MFKNTAHMLTSNGHSVVFFIQQRGFIERLVKQHGFEYKYLVTPLWKKLLKGRAGILLRGAIHLIDADLRLLMFCMFRHIDMMLGSDVSITHIGKVLKKVTIIFTDDDYYFTRDYYRLAYPFASHIFAPEVADVGKWAMKKITYKGTQKTGYLHPRYFVPDVKVLGKYDLSEENFCIVRLVKFDALHDSMHKAESGLNPDLMNALLPILARNGRIIINSENENAAVSAEYITRIDPEDMHSLLYYAKLLITDSQSMHIEAGLLGTPSIRSNKWVDQLLRVNVIDYLENEYGLGVSVSPQKTNEIILVAEDLLNPSKKKEWQSKRDRFFAENTSFTDMLFGFVSEYPSSLKSYTIDKVVIEEIDS
jgi:predicted glycosyltransferase